MLADTVTEKECTACTAKIVSERHDMKLARSDVYTTLFGVHAQVSFVLPIFFVFVFVFGFCCFCLVKELTFRAIMTFFLFFGQ